MILTLSGSLLATTAFLAQDVAGAAPDKAVGKSGNTRWVTKIPEERTARSKLRKVTPIGKRITPTQ
jgi:hypothetical protein